MRISSRWTQTELGTSINFFMLDYKTHYQYVTNTWIKHLWQYIDDCNAQVNIFSETQQCSYSRENDFYLMDEIIRAPISMDKKMIFNQVRLSLKVETASDIVAADSGSRLCPGILDGKVYRLAGQIFVHTQKNGLLHGK